MVGRNPHRVHSFVTLSRDASEITVNKTYLNNITCTNKYKITCDFETKSKENLAQSEIKPDSLIMEANYCDKYDAFKVTRLT